MSLCGLDGGAETRPGPVEQHPLVGLGDAKEVACLFARQSIEIPQRYDESLPFRQVFDLFHHKGGDCLGEEPVIGIAPRFERLGPRAAVGKPVGIDGGSTRACGVGTLVCQSPAAGPVGADPIQPGLQRRASFKALDSSDDGHPRVLDDIFCALGVGYEGARAKRTSLVW